jgi:hypothetical protein
VSATSGEDQIGLSNLNCISLGNKKPAKPYDLQVAAGSITKGSECRVIKGFLILVFYIYRQIYRHMVNAAPVFHYHRHAVNIYHFEISALICFSNSLIIQ